MLNSLIKYWNTKIKFLDEIIFKVLILPFILMLSIIILFCEFLVLKSNNILALFILQYFIFQNGKSNILVNITNPSSATFIINSKKTFLRFFSYQILKENALFFPLLILNSLLSIILTGISIKLAIVNVIALLLQFLIIYISFKTTCYNQRLIPFSKQKNQMSNKNIFINNILSYVFCQNLDTYFTILFEIITVIIVLYFKVSLGIICYIPCYMLVIYIEFLEDKKMQNYDLYYSKFAFKNLSSLSKRNDFFLSDEFKIFLHYFIIELLTVFINAFVAIGFIIVMLAITYRYFCCVNKIFKVRRLFRETYIRFFMSYYIIISGIPVFFDKALNNISGYKPLFGYIFLWLLGILGIIIPLEKIIKIEGANVDVAT